MPDQHELKAFSLASILTDETGQKAIRDGERGTVITMIASTAATDRDSEIILVDGWEWNENPLPKLLWGHDSHSADSVIGRLTRVWKDGGRLMIEAELADKVPEASKARLVAGLLRSGFLDQGSVGFLPKRWRDPDGKVYTSENPGSWWGSVAGRVYESVELIEFSIVPVPSQRESLLAGVRALGLADSSPGASTSRRPVAVAEPEHEETQDPEPEHKSVEQLAADALSDPGDDWLMKLLKNGRGEPVSDAHSSRVESDEDNHAWDGLVADLRSAERVES